MMVLATNRAEDLDSAVLDRMDESLYLGLPDAEKRRSLTVSDSIVLIKKKTLFCMLLLCHMVCTVDFSFFYNFCASARITFIFVPCFHTVFIVRRSTSTHTCTRKRLRADEHGSRGGTPARWSEPFSAIGWQTLASHHLSRSLFATKTQSQGKEEAPVRIVLLLLWNNKRKQKRPPRK